MIYQFMDLDTGNMVSYGKTWPEWSEDVKELAKSAAIHGDDFGCLLTDQLWSANMHIRRNGVVWLPRSLSWDL